MKPLEEPDYRISMMSQEELATAVDWARKEGWNPGVDDAALFYAADPTGFLAGKHGERIVASISAVKYGSAFGFIGLYIVSEEFRGRGWGFQLWEAAVASLSGRNIGLDGVLAQQENYRKSGFRLAHRNIRFAGKSSGQPGPFPDVIDAQAMDFAKIAEYDGGFFPAERRPFLRRWISAANSRSLVMVENAGLVGYGTLRACVDGFKLGPLNAQNGDIAAELFSALTASLPAGSAIFLDVPEPNGSAIRLAEKFGMSPVFETARMYTKDFPPLPLDRIFGITSFELG